MQRFILLLLVYLLLTTPLHAYWSQAHMKFAETIVDANDDISVAEKTKSIAVHYSQVLGFPLNKTYTFDDVEQVNPLPFISSKTDGALTKTVPNVKKRGTNILIEGADDEDYPFIRAVNHFFDPAHDHSLVDSLWHRKEFLYQGDDFLTGISVAIFQANKTPDWALEDNFTIPGYLRTDPLTGVSYVENKQNDSLRDSYDLLNNTLFESDVATRTQNTDTLTRSEQPHV